MRNTPQEIRFAVSTTARLMAEDDEVLLQFFSSVLDEELIPPMRDGNDDTELSQVLEKINQRLLKHYGYRFFAWVKDNDLDEVAVITTGTVTLVLDTLYQHNHMLVH